MEPTGNFDYDALPSLAEKWDFNPARFRRGIQLTRWSNRALIASSAGIAAWQTGSLGFVILSAALGWLWNNFAERKDTGKLLGIMNEHLHDAPLPIVNTVSAVAARAGIKKRIKVQIVEMPMSSGVRKMPFKSKYEAVLYNFGGMAMPSAPHSPDPHIILLGCELIKDRDAAGATIAHEVGHLLNPDLPQFDPLVSVGLRMHFCMACAALSIGEPALAALSAGTGFVGAVIRAQSARLDELRADYNGLALNPDLAASQDELKTTRDKARAALSYRPRSLRGVWNSVRSFFFAGHPATGRRIAALEETWPKVQALYEKNPPMMPHA
ncbi:MAG: hypothetical protein EOM26_05605 [Alphaproteobacteria bacterium]|nr:hypothetical protein [Alphaproteobacteria bacterium]